MKKQSGVICAIIAGLLTMSTAPVSGEDYPAKPIRIIVPTAAGGLTDLLARTFGQYVSDETKQAVVVENRAGGGGLMAADAVAKSPPDGYTLLSGFHGVLAILQHLQKLPYDPQKDLVPIIHIATVPNILLINSGLDIGSLKDLIAYAKANPGKLTYASQGNGSSGHMAGEQFKLATGVDIVHVPYRGAAPAVQDLLAGHVSMMFDVVALALPQLASGKVRALGVAAPQRVAALPDVPTLAEAGLPGVEGGAFFGLVAPAGTRPEIVEWLNRAGNKVFSDAKIRDQYISQGAILPLGKPEAFAAYIANESNRWGDVISRGGIRLQ